ncbi:transcriptional regulator [Corynebacterium aquilae]|uniref:Winged helix DNA-binding domain-containing protein n=1 Tax=Corynebacterium aquilae DSM 44791 TaxID=1431546 RepID=A0A1L7CHE6_9CORY|nr:transcriptional regulator [Corynebacterium aquilae]APT85249.1 hypothetical protein CAQU_09390 [Corynebacterium aquilae DSM 44791]
MGEIDPTIHPIARLKICAALAAARADVDHREMRFSNLAKVTDLSPSALSKNLSTLEAKNYINRIREWGTTRDKDQVWVSLTRQGLAAYESHVEALRELAGDIPTE